MKPFLAALFLFLLANLAPGEGRAESPEEPNFHFGVSPRVFESVRQNDAIAAFKAWATTVVKERGMREQVGVNMFDRPEDMRAAFSQGQLDAICIPADELTALKMQTETVILPTREDGIKTFYALLVHRDSGIENIGDLRGKTIVLYEGPGMSLARPWLESVFAGQFPKAKSPEANLNVVEKPLKGILQVFFRQADASLTTTAAFELASQMNPQLRNNLKVLAVSPPLVPTIFMFNPRYKGKSREDVEAAIIDLHKTPGGRQVLTVFQSSRLERHPVSVLHETLHLISEHKSQWRDARGARK